MKRTPLVLVAGFLGAGKTTFLRKLTDVLEADCVSVSVVINDYENAEIDALSLRRPGREVTAVSGSCICCDSLLPLTLALLRVPEDGRQVVLVEANGTADPLPLLSHLLETPVLRDRFSPILQVTVIDAGRWQDRGVHRALERRQVESASHLCLNRENTIDPCRLSAIRSEVAILNPRADWCDPTSVVASLRSEQGVVPATGQRDTQLHRHSDAYVGIQLDLPEPIAAQALQRWLHALPPEVLRAKGVVRLAEFPDRWFHFQQIEGIRGEASMQALPKQPNLAPCAVLIGVRLDLDHLSRLRNRTLGSPTFAHGGPTP